MKPTHSPEPAGEDYIITSLIVMGYSKLIQNNEYATLALARPGPWPRQLGLRLWYRLRPTHYIL